jgi:prepilin-type N-terminal cleavage/methylation domain-containing protein
MAVNGRGGNARREGLTLLEVLIAVALLAIVMGSSMAALIQARFLARAASHQAYALQVARSNIEALRYSFGYADPVLSVTAPGTSHTNMPSDLPRLLTVGDRNVWVDYRPSYTVAETTLAGGLKYKTVNFQVTWNEPTFRGSKPLSVRLNTVIASVLDR